MINLKTLSKAPAFILSAIVLLLLAGTILSRCVAADVTTTSESMDMSSWKNTPGVSSATAEDVTVQALDEKIVNQDGSGGQANPAVNTTGQHLEFTGDFTLTMPLAKSSGQSVELRLYNTPPVIYDEWRAEPASIGVTVSDSTAQVRLWDGSSQSPVLSRQLTTGQANQVQVSRSGRNVLVSVGTAHTSLSATKQFASGSLWFGASTNRGEIKLNKFSVVSSSAKPAHFVAVVAAKRTIASSSLRATAETRKTRTLKVGTAISVGPLMSDVQYRSKAINEFNMWTTENDLKPQFVQPAQGQFVFGPSDVFVQMAQDNGIMVHGHALVFGEANPRWMQAAPAAEKSAIMRTHIQTVVGHYKGKIAEWDVVNEPLSDEDVDYQTNGLRHHIWYQAMGEDYIAQAFRTAHAADPAAKLYLNDYGLEADGDRWDALMALLTRLQKQKVPINGIGFQSHIYEDDDSVDPAVLTRHMQQLARLGLSSRISEIDVHGEDADEQAMQYQLVLQSCLKVPSCTGFSTWGVTDKYGSTTTDHTYPAEYGNDLLWDAKYRPKAAYTLLQHTLQISR